MPVTGRIVRLAVAAVLGVVATALLGVAPGAADDTCASFGATAAADAVRVSSNPAGLAPVDEADGEGPAAQAHVDSLGVSTGFAGIPYSKAAVGNAGAGGVDHRDVPVMVTSAHPTNPDESRSTPAGSLKATSQELASRAEAVAGGPGDEQTTVGRSRAAAEASCATTGAVKASSTAVSEASSFGGGVLRIGSVRTTATAATNAAGSTVLRSSIDVDGASVLGQRVSIGDRGLVIGSAATSLGGSPLAQALDQAGISVRHVAATRDADGKGIVAPGLEVTVRRGAQGVTSGDGSVTYTFGRAYARASSAGTSSTDGVVVPDDVGGGPSSTFDGTGPTTGGAPDLGAPAPLAELPAPVAERGGGSAGRGGLASIVNTSSASVYPALVGGAAALVAAFVLFEALGLRLRWRA